MKLATKLIILFLLLTTIPLVIVGYLAYDNGRRTIEQNVLNHLISTNILKQNEFDRWVHDNERSLRNLARRPGLTEHAAVLASHDPNDSAYQAVYASLIEDHLSPTLEEEGGFLDLSILRGDDGLILISTHKSLEGKYRESESFFVEGKKRTYVENVAYSLALEGLVMHISTPIQDREGNLIAVLAGHADLADMSNIMEQRSGLSRTEDTYLVNTFNFFATEPKFGEGYALRKAIRTEGVEACLQGKEGVGFYDDYRGVTVIGAFRWMPERELCILTEVDQAEAYAPVVALRNTVLGIGLAVALIVALLGVLFARTITRPVRQLVEGAEEIGRGNLEYRIEVGVRDEIGQLSQAFNQMTENLQAITASRDELNREVAERKRAEEELKQTLAELEASRAAALNMMADAEEARTAAEQANEKLRREIAERMRVEAELERSNRELEQFAYVASHDLQEPLRKVQVFGDRLKARQAQAFDEQGRDYLERMQDAARRMHKMINDLLTFSRVATRVEPFVPVDLRQVAQEAVSALEVQIEQSGGRIVIGDLPTLEADPTQMRQLLVNLIGNGLKFHRQGVAPVVEISSEQIKRRRKELCQVLVKDNGIGFDEKYLDRLFKPFQRLHGRGKYPGTGIGLAICRRIAERHGGSITAQSAPGEGATFIVTLPVQQKRET